MKGVRRLSRGGSWRHPSPAGSIIGLALVTLFLILSIHAIFAKKLVGTIVPQEWGRYLYGVSVALTASKYGIGGFVYDNYIVLAVMRAGLSDRELELSPLGVTFPDNL